MNGYLFTIRDGQQALLDVDEKLSMYESVSLEYHPEHDGYPPLLLVDGLPVVLEKGAPKAWKGRVPSRSLSWALEENGELTVDIADNDLTFTRRTGYGRVIAAVPVIQANTPVKTQQGAATPVSMPIGEALYKSLRKRGKEKRAHYEFTLGRLYVYPKEGDAVRFELAEVIRELVETYEALHNKGTGATHGRQHENN